MKDCPHLRTLSTIKVLLLSTHFIFQVSDKFQSIADMIAGKPYEQHVVSRYYAIENSSNDQVDAEVIHVLLCMKMAGYDFKTPPLVNAWFCLVLVLNTDRLFNHTVLSAVEFWSLPLVENQNIILWKNCMYWLNVYRPGMISVLFYMFDLYNVWEQRETLHWHFFTIRAYNLRNNLPQSLISFEP